MVEAYESSETKIQLSDTGYLIERDGYVKSENKYNTIVDNDFVFDSYNGLGYSFKFPDDDDLTDSQVEYIKSCIDELEKSFDLSDSTNDTYDQYIDLRSWAAWHLTHDLVGQRDCGGTNRYISKYDNTNNSKFEMACPWDFQTGYLRGNYNKWTNIHTLAFPNPFFSQALFESENKAFVNEFKVLFHEIEPTFIDSMSSSLENFEIQYGEAINKSRLLDDRRWNSTSKTVEEDIETMLTYFTNRINWINNNIDNL